MWALLATTILTSAADSLNPIAITQQFVLQGMVKKPSHIWFFILPTGITNLIGGFFAYFGLAALVGRFWQGMMERLGPVVYALGLTAGAALLGFACWLALRKPRTDGLPNDGQAQAARKIRSVTPFALVLLGVGATVSELATALPYFAFLAVLLNFSLRFWQLALILVVYNTIYTLPLALLYLAYRTAQGRFDRLYAAVQDLTARLGHVLAPVMAGGLGAFLVYAALPRLW